MTTKEAISQLGESLQTIMDAREATNVANIVFEDVFAWKRGQGDRQLSNSEQEEWVQIKNRLLSGEPLQYVLGMADFYGLTFKVNPTVLIPRPETEELVYQILARAKDHSWSTGLDIGTGSGCIPISLKKSRPDWQLSAMEISHEALAVAQENAVLNEVNLQWIRQSVLEKANWSSIPSFDFIVSNPPYIPDREREVMSHSVIDFEPEIALFVPDADPFLFYRTILYLAEQKLNPGGALFFEVNEFNAKDLLGIVPDQLFESVELIQDMQGKDRIFYGQKARLSSRSLR